MVTKEEWDELDRKVKDWEQWRLKRPSCRWCGAIKRTKVGLCPNCGRFGHPNDADT